MEFICGGINFGPEREEKPPTPSVAAKAAWRTADIEAAREQAAWLLRTLELMAMGAGDIEITRHGRAMTREEMTVWARVNADAIRTIFEASGLSTEWRTDGD